MPRKSNATYETESEPFPTKLRELLYKRKMTQGDLAKAISVSRQAISLYCTGQSVPDIKTLAKMADLFAVSADYMLGRTPNETVDLSIQTACMVTGLTDTAVTLLNHFQNDEVLGCIVPTISLLIEQEMLFFCEGDKLPCEGYQGLFKYIHQYLYATGNGNYLMSFVVNEEENHHLTLNKGDIIDAVLIERIKESLKTLRPFVTTTKEASHGKHYPKP